MNIPMKYEDVVAKLDAALGREAALREELSTLADDYCEKVDDLIDLQQRLTVAEQRASDLEAFLLESNELLYVIQDGLGGNLWSAVDVLRGKVFTALKPAAEVDHGKA